jgi:hypothetical protein
MSLRPLAPSRPTAALALALALTGCGKSSRPPPAARAVAVDPTRPVLDEGGAKLAPIVLQANVYEKPDHHSAKLGYLRLGEVVARAQVTTPGDACPEGWYAIAPAGYVCAGEEASLDLGHKVIRALGIKPDLTKPMPYTYGFVRAGATLYQRVPPRKEQERFEFALRKFRRAYAKHHVAWNHLDKPGANHVPLDAAGNATLAPKDVPPPPAQPDEDNLFGVLENGKTPWWLEGKRQIPNISSFSAPPYALYSGRVDRHAGLAILGSFRADEKAGSRKFAVLLDGRIVGEDKLKPHYASAFHGVALDGSLPFPFAMIKRQGAGHYAPSPASAHEWPRLGDVTYRDLAPLSGRSRLVDDERYLETRDGRWLRQSEIAVFEAAPELPKRFDPHATKWIDVSIWQQTLVMYEGDKPVYATLVSTGVDGMGDPATTKSTVRGEFRIDTKHVTATMDADDPENKFELRDVPWVQYFERGYALHTAYWHDDFGRPRSHGCVNLAPVDARKLFFWTDPPLPASWHGVRAGDTTGLGTWVRVRG